MAITITTADVKRKAVIPSTDTSHDQDIAALIEEMQPAIEREIYVACLEDTTDTGLQAILKLGILEIITGEFLEQLAREAGACETVTAAGISIGTPLRSGPDLISQGRQRLVQYLASTYDGARSNTMNAVPMFSREEE